MEPTFQEVPEVSTYQLMKRLVRSYIRHYNKTIALAVICMIVASAAVAANAALLQPVLDEIFLSKDKTMLFLLPVAIVLVAVLGGAANYGQIVLMRKVGQGIIAEMQMDLFSHFMRSDLGLFHRQSAGKLISRFTNDIQLMRNAVSTVLTGLAKELLSMIFLIGIMFYQSWELSLAAFFLFPVAIHPIIRLGKKMRRITDKTQEALSEFAGQLDETFQAARVVKAYHREDFEVARAQAQVNELYRLYLKASRVQALASPMIESFAAVAIAGIVAYGGYQVMEGQTTPGAFFSFIAAMIMAYKPLRAMAGFSTQLQEGLSAARRFFTAVDEKPIVQEKPDAVELVVRGGEIRLDHVSFHYYDNIPALEEVSLVVPSGKMAALVGASGAGKSTIMNLLLRFYDVTGGAITIDGQDLRDVTFRSLRESVAYVGQEVILFDDTVAQNIAYGRQGAHLEEIYNAAKAADAHDFIAALPEGYNTKIGPHGVTLSGGQRQRLSIARAILKNAPILLLDEATSALDTASEKSVQKALDELMQHRTSLVIAHRLSTIRHADIIYVMEAGKVVEFGSHNALLERGGAYARLHQVQFSGISE